MPAHRFRIFTRATTGVSNGSGSPAAVPSGNFRAIEGPPGAPAAAMHGAAGPVTDCSEHATCTPEFAASCVSKAIVADFDGASLAETGFGTNNPDSGGITHGFVRRTEIA